MKKALALALAFAMLLTGNVFALDHKNTFDNEATFETMEEAHVNGAEWLSAETGRNYIPDPAMDDYPEGTTYVYRSPNMYTSMTAALRMNTNFLVYTDAAFESKDDAYTYLEDMGLIDYANEGIGSIILVTPINPETGFGAADQVAYYKLQSAMCNLLFATGDRSTPMNEREYYADNSYYGGLTYRYAIGIDGGATFLNNYVSSVIDYGGRLAGMLLIGGKMDSIRDIPAPIPAYLVNATERAIDKYAAANGVDAWGHDGGLEICWNKALPLQKVCACEAEEIDLKTIVADAYNRIFLKTMRIPVVKAGLYTPGTLYDNYNFNEAPYSIAKRVAWFTGRTEGGLIVTEHVEDRFADICTENGEYLQSWTEILPEEVLDGTAAPASIPLILANHGGGDDELQFVDEIGLLPVAERERVAIGAAYHGNITAINNKALPAFVRYLLDEYPALDPSRVYVCGYSMGGMATHASIYGAPELFAAACPMAIPYYYATDEELENMKNYEMPYMMTTSTYDAFYADGVGVTFNYPTYLNLFLSYNGIDEIEFDFDTYLHSGFAGDIYTCELLNGEYYNHTWLMRNADGIPMVGLNVTEDLIHALYPEYGEVVWNFFKHYSRDPETAKISYTETGF